MTKDRRKKTCPNGDCEFHNKIKQSIDMNYCPKCGKKLILVCANHGCFNEIEDRGKEHYYCDRCDEEKKDRQQKHKDTAKEYAVKAGQAVEGAVFAVGVGIVKKLSSDGQKSAIKAGTKYVKDAAKFVVKK